MAYVRTPGSSGQVTAASTFGGSASRAQPCPSLSTAGTNLGGTTRCRHIFPVSVSRFEILYGNYYNNNGVEADGPNPYTVRAAVEYPSGTFTPLFVNGSRDITVAPGSTVKFDPCTLTIPASTQFWVRTYVNVTANTMQWPLVGALDVANGEGSVVSATPSDQTTSGTIGPNAGFGMIPFAVRPLGLSAGTLTLGIVGDSISFGLYDTIGGRGWTGQAFDNAALVQKIAYSSERAAVFNDPNGRKRRIGLLNGCNVGICAMGTNDVSFAGASLSSVQTILQSTWAAMASLGMKVFQTTITPRTTSTDTFATTGSQTVAATESTIRVPLNDWIRTTPSGLTGYIELADTVETARNSGIWKATGTAQGYTQDGTHPVAAGYALMAAAATGALPALQSAAR